MNPVRLAFIGCGGWARKKYIPYLLGRPDVTIVAVARLVYPAETDAFRQRVPAAHLFADEAEMLAVEKPDGVIVSLPPACVAATLRTVVAHGTPFMVDKPFTTSVAEAEEIVREATARGVAAGVCHQRRAYPAIAAARDLLDNGGRAQLRWITASFFLHSYPAWLTSWRNDPAYTGDAALRQGILLDAGYHLLDSILYLLDFELPHRVIGSAAYREARVETDVTAILEFAGERRATLQVSRHFPATFELESLELLGDGWFARSLERKGEGADAASFQLFREGEPSEQWGMAAGNAPVAPIAAFVAHLQGSAFPALWSARGAVPTLRVMDALYRSMREGTPVVMVGNGHAGQATPR